MDERLRETTPLEARAALRRSLRLVTLAWGFGAAWMYITTGAVMTRYAKSVGMSEFGFGVLAAIPFAGALVQLPASLWIERRGGRKRLFMVAGLLHRGMWLVIAAIPWLFPQANWWWLLLVVLSFSTVLANLMGPAWMTWMADLVPDRMRGRFFSRRIQYGQIVALTTTLMMGFALDQATAIDEYTLRRVISAALATAAIFGMLDIAMFRWVDDPSAHYTGAPVSLWQLFREPLADANFKRFLLFNGTLTFAVGYVGQFIWLYLFDVVGMTNMRANVMLIAVPLAVSMLAFPIWGRLVDRLGCKPVLVIAGAMIIHGGASWIFVTKENWWLGYMAVLSATAAWPGIEMASLNLLLDMSGSSTDKGRRGSSYSAVNSVVIAVAGVLSGIFGGVVAQWLRHWHGSLFGWPLSYHGVLFLISAGLRCTALFWLFGIREPGAHTTREAARYMFANIYSNLSQAIFFPLRGLGKLWKTTFRP